MPETNSIADAGSLADLPRVPVDMHLLGQVSFEHALSLQRRLAYELGGELRPRIVVLLCEHEPLISVGRRGSRGHVQLSGDELRLRNLAVQWIGRGGGCILHGPGQLSVYCLAPLNILQWSLGQYLERLQQGVQAALLALPIAARTGQHDCGLWGRSGQLAAMGVAVRHGITLHGMFLNVNPPMHLYRAIYTPQAEEGFGSEQRTMGCLVAERSQGVKMSQVQTALVEHLPPAFGAEQANVFSGHPFLPRPSEYRRGPNARAS